MTIFEILWVIGGAILIIVWIAYTVFVVLYITAKELEKWYGIKDE